MNRVRNKNIDTLEERATHVALCDSVGSYLRYWCGAFTLAEVLITLGIIGIVAAMTIPSLVQDYREKAQVTRVKKFYSVFSQAYTMALQDNGPFDTWGLSDSVLNIDESGNGIQSEESLANNDKFMQIMSKYLQKAGYEKLHSNIQKENVGFVLPDGTNIRGMWLQPSTCDSSNVNSYCGDVYIHVGNKKSNYDENGKKLLNNDVFAFYIQPHRIYPFGTNNAQFKNECLSGKNYSRCSGWVIMNGNMDYLHCKDLDINTKTSCK